ncbi:MAG: type II secretion system F family protein [Homoserinimonas sp.]|nr:type II secretion system F family protein [Homoserinimonas sp.]MCW5944784.1 type II secretion system F family protein [Cryobacterium sp.]
MSNNFAWAILIGCSLGTGMWLLLSLIPNLARPKLASRVAPYVAQFSEGAKSYLPSATPRGTAGAGSLFEPIARGARRVSTTLMGGGSALRLALRRSGTTESLENFRFQQLVWMAVGAATGLAAVLILTGFRLESLPVVVVGALFGAGLGYFLRQQVLFRSARRRIARISEELPVVLEFMTLSLTAGEGILDSLRRASGLGKGELSKEFASVVVEVNSGIGIGEALKRLADSLEFLPLSRLVDQLLGALDRGTPLAEVLRAQAQDAREQSKRELLEIAGRKEVAMMIPLVFGVLPVSIIFAVFPGIFVLQLGF